MNVELNATSNRRMTQKEMETFLEERVRVIDINSLLLITSNLYQMQSESLHRILRDLGGWKKMPTNCWHNDQRIMRFERTFCSNFEHNLTLENMLNCVSSLSNKFWQERKKIQQEIVEFLKKETDRSFYLEQDRERLLQTYWSAVDNMNSSDISEEDIKNNQIYVSGLSLTLDLMALSPSLEGSIKELFLLLGLRPEDIISKIKNLIFDLVASSIKEELQRSHEAAFGSRPYFKSVEDLEKIHKELFFNSPLLKGEEDEEE